MKGFWLSQAATRNQIVYGLLQAKGWLFSMTSRTSI
jgi:hypothetical protein